MNERPRPPEVTTSASGGDRTRGQSDVLAIVLLLGMIFVSAIAVVVAGGFLVDSVQQNSQHQLAVDSAVQTHQQISEALQSGEPRELAVTDAVEMDVRDSGSLSIEMYNSSNPSETCLDAPSVPDDAHVNSTSLGAIVYETPRGEVIYEGGAIWERTDAGYAIERNPPISYDGDTARISVQTVTADADSFESGIASPQVENAMVQNTTSMLRHCPPAGFTGIEISVTSPYHQLWNRTFQESVATGPNVSVDHYSSNETVVADITNATNPHASRGLRFANFTHTPVVGDPDGEGNLTSEFWVDVEVANDAFSTRRANVELIIPGYDSSPHTDSPHDVPPSGADTVSMNFTGTNVSMSLDWSDLRSQLATGEIHDYTLRLTDSYGNVAENVTGEFFLAEEGGGKLTLAGTDETLDPAHDSLSVNATLVNTKVTHDETDVTFNITDPRIDTGAVTEPNVNVSKHGGTAEVSFGVDVSSLPAGLYEYQVNASGADNSPITAHFAIMNRSQSNLVGQLLVKSVDAPLYVETDNGSFDVDTGLVNLGENSASGSLALDVSGLPTTYNNVTDLSAYTETSRTLSIPEGQLDSLEAGEVHNYTVTLESGGGVPFTTNGSFYLGHSGPYPRVENVASDGENSTITATIANHGLANVSENVTLTMYDGGSELGSATTSEYHLVPGQSQTVIFEINESNLAGSYDYDVTFGNTTSGTINFSGVSDGGGDVTITAPGTGTVTVLGTEVSGAQWENKYWAPVSVTSILDIDGTQTTHEFSNDATDDPGSLHTLRNLNSYDTQDATYSHNWTQVEGETATLTVASTLWQQQINDYDHVNSRYHDGEMWDDYHPPDWAWNDPYNEVNANAGNNPSNVQVLLDGDQVPNVHAAGNEQRSAAEILNQGAADRVNGEGELDLGPNEAIFLFELSDRSATWEEADESQHDPDYNDVIVLVGFNPEEPGSVSFDVEDGNSLIIGPANPDAGDNESSQSVGGIDPSVEEGDGGGPQPPDPTTPDPGNPSQPDEIDVDVGGVVVG